MPAFTSDPTTLASAAAAAVASVWVFRKARQRLELSLAKAPTLGGHVRWAQRIARQIPGYSYDATRWFQLDDAPMTVVQQRRDGLQRLGQALRSSSPHTLALTEQAEPYLPDLQFTRRYRVPFQFREVFLQQVPITSFWARSEGNQLFDADGKAYWDVTGSYGLNVLGTDFYKAATREGIALTEALGPVLGSYHPCVLDNVQRLCALSGMEEVSFHMSGTEAVMQAVRLARYHTRRQKVVRFAGAYHGWWDDVQPGPGNPNKPAANTLTLREGHANTLRVLRKRRDIACVLINPLQSMHPNGAAPSDSTLVANERKAAYDRAQHTRWLQELRQVCSERGIALIFDEVFMGFRLGVGGAQQYFGVQADMVTYGKTLGGGLPVGVVCGKRAWMQRYRDDRPADICFARGTFVAHPYVMGAMNAFLRQLDQPAVQQIFANSSAVWAQRLQDMNAALAGAGYPVRFVGMETVWALLFDTPSRYNWLLQFYLREQGIALSWVGTGRWIFNLSYTDAEFAQLTACVLSACAQMQRDGWWWTPPGADAKTIKRSVLRELLQQRLR